MVLRAGFTGTRLACRSLKEEDWKKSNIYTKATPCKDPKHNTDIKYRIR